jgi:hypothetical protein
MKMHPLGMIAVCIVALGVGVAVAPWLGWTLGIGAIGGGAMFLTATRCRHRHATLLPPVHDGGPERDHARWYCDHCGSTWPAAFVAETRPRVIYQGYDEHLARRAAARADTLERERRRMAVKRAGWSHSTAAAQTARPVARPLEVVPLRRATK